MVLSGNVFLFVKLLVNDLNTVAVMGVLAARLDVARLTLVLRVDTEEDMLDVRVEKKAFPEDGGEFILLLSLLLWSVVAELSLLAVVVVTEAAALETTPLADVTNDHIAIPPIIVLQLEPPLLGAAAAEAAGGGGLDDDDAAESAAAILSDDEPSPSPLALGGGMFAILGPPLSKSAMVGEIIDYVGGEDRRVHCHR